MKRCNILLLKSWKLYSIGTSNKIVASFLDKTPFSLLASIFYVICDICKMQVNTYTEIYKLEKNICGILKQMQYIFAVNFGTLSSRGMQILWILPWSRSTSKKKSDPDPTLLPNKYRLLLFPFGLKVNIAFCLFSVCLIINLLLCRLIASLLWSVCPCLIPSATAAPPPFS